jgi:hypothetical protein
MEDAMRIGRGVASVWIGRIGVCLAAAAVAGCASALGSVSAGGDGVSSLPKCIKDTFVNVKDGELKKEFVDSAAGEMTGEEDGASASRGAQPAPNIDGFLDCAIGPADPANLEMRLLRGHIAVAMLAQYGTLNVKRGDDKHQKDDATALLADIEKAEEKLRAPSAVLSGKTHETATPTVDKLRRIEAIFDVAIDAERPAIRKLRGKIMTIAAAIGGSPGAIADAVRDALGGIKRAIILKYYGWAYRKDSRDFLRKIQEGKDAKTVQPTANDWALWDQAESGVRGARGDVRGNAALHSEVARSQISPRLLKLAWPDLAMTIWSCSAMPSFSQASFTSRVMATSPDEGVGSPLGWLWTRMIAVAFNSSARFTTSRG